MDEEMGNLLRIRHPHYDEIRFLERNIYMIERFLANPNHQEFEIPEHLWQQNLEEIKRKQREEKAFLQAQLAELKAQTLPIADPEPEIYFLENALYDLLEGEIDRLRIWVIPEEQFFVDVCLHHSQNVRFQTSKTTFKWPLLYSGFREKSEKGYWELVVGPNLSALEIKHEIAHRIYGPFLFYRKMDEMRIEIIKPA
ncbi:MAG: hypothetical protein AAFP89_23495 [Bacteroidota bacterium]